MVGQAHAAAGSSSNIMDRVRDDFMSMTEFFDTVLPGTLQRYNTVLDFTPKFTDVRAREFIRFPLELRYGASDTLELFAGLTPFVPNPFNNGWDHRFGPGEARFGFRKNFDNGFLFFDEATYGLETRIPLGKPPYDLIEGYSHVRPFITASRRLVWPHTKVFTTLAYDREVNTPGRDKPSSTRVVRQHIAEVAPGFLYKPGEYGGFFEYEFRHLDEDDGYRLSHGCQIGMIWDLPRDKTKSWKLPGKWQIEIAYKVIKEEGRSVDMGIITHVRVRTTLHEVMNSDLTRKLIPGQP